MARGRIYGDARRNTTSDELVGPSTSMRWFSQNMLWAAYEHPGRGGHGQDSFSIRNVDNKYRGPRTLTHMSGRDAFSGVVLWYNENATIKNMYMVRDFMTGHDLGFIHPQPGNDQPVVLTDRHTGKFW